MPVAHERRPITVVATVDEVRLIDAGRLVAYDPVHYLALYEDLRTGAVQATDVAAYGALLSTGRAGGQR